MLTGTWEEYAVAHARTIHLIPSPAAPPSPVLPPHAPLEQARPQETPAPNAGLTHDILTRFLFALAALSALVGVGLDMWIAYHVSSWVPASAGWSTSFGPGWSGSLNRLAYFTAQANVLVAFISITCAIWPRSTSRGLAGLQICALVAITLTGSVYVGVLAGPNLGVPFPPQVIIATTLEHIVTPLLAWAAWLWAGPARVTWVRVTIASIMPVMYCLFTLVRGAIVDWYPYPFMDIPRLGYGHVALNVAIIACVVSVVGVALWAIQRWLGPAGSARC